MMTELRFRYGTPAEYLELLRRTAAIIKEENPAAKIIVTADYTDTQAEAFTDGFLDLGGADYLDYLSFHPYNAIDPNGRYDLAETITQEKILSQKYHKPLMISEIGQPDQGIGEELQARVAETLFKVAHEQAFPIVWFHYSDKLSGVIDGKSGWGLMRKDSTPKPAYERLKQYINSIRL